METNDRLDYRHRNKASDPHWHRPTGHDRRRIEVAPQEMTCTRCYETFTAAPDAYCERCGLIAQMARPGQRDLSQQPPAVPTLSYLRRHEYQIIGEPAQYDEEDPE